MVLAADTCDVAASLSQVELSGGLYSVRQVADQLGVHPETIRRLIHDGRLNAVKVGRVLRIDASELDIFLARQRVKPDRPAPSAH
jgi:excisionase family DNA binding protein